MAPLGEEEASATPWPPTTLGEGEGEGGPGGPSKPIGDAAAPAPLPVDGGRYEIVGLLGKGGMGEVYEARDRRLGRSVALKLLRSSTPAGAARLRQEARAQARVDHPNVCKVYEVGGDGDGAYIAMQLVRGERLDLAAAGLTLPAKVLIMREVAGAVHEAHRLGVVHRDLKPSNVLVGRDEGGRWSPIVMDFGLAYEVDRGHGLTETGALLGTPAYMAPEQARGELSAVDQRSDVYALGATLYCLLAGAPPFEGATRAATLHRALTEEPPPLRAGLPRDLETIALKCLQKDPARRYPTARALAEDLGRFLDGEPIVGRRPGPLERLARAARRNPALAAALALALAFGAFGARGRFEAARARAEAAGRARLAEELGRQVEQIEWVLRAAYALPLHDAGPEERRVRERMAAIAARRPEPGGYGEGLAHYALGQGHLSLGELEAARGELERARSLGIDSPELHRALGRALGELYRRSLERARRGGGPEWFATRQRDLERLLLAPALAELERGRAPGADSPALLEGLLALYRRDYDAAEGAAARAIDEAPWALEARRLAGDVAYARAMEQFERGDYDAAGAGLERATDRYARAASVGRSDARAHEAEAEAWLQSAELERRRGRPAAAAIGRALAAADRAIEAAPARASGHARRAQALRLLYVARAEEGAGDAVSVLADLCATGERAVALDPLDVYAYDALGQGNLQRGLHEASEGRDPRPAWGEAAAHLGRALEVEPDYPWALNDLGVVYRWRGNYDREHGRDPRADYEEAERRLRRAAESDPNYLFAHDNLSRVYEETGSYRLSRGLDPEAEVQKALDAGARALAVDASYAPAHRHLAAAELTRAQYLDQSGGDPGAAVERVLAHLERSRAANASSGQTALLRAHAHLLVASHALRSGGAPRPALEAARAALAEAQRGAVDCADCRVVGARWHSLDAALALREGRPAAPALRRALAEARRAVELYPYADAHEELARACLRLAGSLPAGEAAALLDEGERQIDRALALDPGLATAHAVRGALLLARSRSTAAPERKPELAREARAALDRALEFNPLVERDDSWPREPGRPPEADPAAP